MNKLRTLTIVLTLAFTACSYDGSTAVDAPIAFANPLLQQAQNEIERSPELPLGYVNLAMLLMKESRRTGDFSLNDRAQDAVNRALELDPAGVPARKLTASLHLAHHRFAEAIDVASKLRTEYPSDSFIHGVLTDAYMEIGKYDLAIESAQQMVNLKPGSSSYSRVAQLRSLHGDHKGAVEMFTQAARAADPSDQETRAWCLVQLGDEFWKNGNYAEAEKIYDEALQIFPGYFLAIVSKGRLRASVGDFEAAEKLLTEVQTAIPNANATLLLGHIFKSRGDIERANRQYDAFESMQDKLGTAADHRRLGLLLADRGKLEQALSLARKEYAAEKSINSADLLAWSLFRIGRPEEAKIYIREAIRLKTNDATLLFHAGMIARATGDSREASRLLTATLKLNPGFDPLHAEDARQALAELR